MLLLIDTCKYIQSSRSGIAQQRHALSNVRRASSRGDARNNSRTPIPSVDIDPATRQTRQPLASHRFLVRSSATSSLNIRRGASEYATKRAHQSTASSPVASATSRSKFSYKKQFRGCRNETSQASYVNLPCVTSSLTMYNYTDFFSTLIDIQSYQIPREKARKQTVQLPSLRSRETTRYGAASQAIGYRAHRWRNN